MAEEKKQQTPVGLLESPDTEQEQVDESYDKSPIDAVERPPQKHTSSTETSRPARKKKKRPTKVEIDNRNRAVTEAAIEFQFKQNRLPTVGEIAAETGYSQRQIYSTTAYKEGKIAKKPSKSISDVMGGSVGEIGHYGGKSIQGPTAMRGPASKQIELVAPVEQQDTETKDVGTMELTEDGSYICYLCGCRIPAKLNTDNRCRKCGDRACFSCLELVDTPDGLCAYCDYKARMWHKSAFVCTVIVVIITLCFLLIRLFPEHRQTISNSLGL